jgi:hypothetical protein
MSVLQAETNMVRLNKKELKQRGWTDTLITKLLGGPDEYGSGHGKYGQYEIHWYDLARIAVAEKRPELVTRMQKVAKEREETELWHRQWLIKAEIEAEFALEGTIDAAWCRQLQIDLDTPYVKMYALTSLDGSYKPQPSPGEVCRGLWSLNRIAKRKRDEAQLLWQAREHTQSKQKSAEKRAIYLLKGQALHYLLAEDILSVESVHRFDEECAQLLSGQGYRFHRPAPAVESAVNIGVPQIDAKPVDVSEMEEFEANQIIRKYLSGRAFVSQYEWPKRARRHESDDYWGRDAYNEN